MKTNKQTSAQTLEFLDEFCQQSLDLRSAENSEKQRQVAAELPALWPNIISILNLEKSDYLPGDVSVIISKLIFIRRNTFLTAAVRSDDDYVKWEDSEQEHCTMFYPYGYIQRNMK